MEDANATLKKCFNILKYAVVMLAGIALVAIVGLFVFSYGIVKSLTVPNARPSNEIELSRKKTLPVVKVTSEPIKTHQAMEASPVYLPTIPKTEKVNSDRRHEFIRRLDAQDQLDVIGEELLSGSAPHFCEMICGDSAFRVEHEYNEHGLEAVLRFYKHEGSGAFNDPRFRIAFETTFPVRTLFPRSLREFLVELDRVEGQTNQMTNFEIASLAARFQLELIPHLLSMKADLPLLKHRRELLKEVRSLRNQCGRTSAAEIQMRCREINPEF